MNLIELEAEMKHRQEQCRKSASRRRVFVVGRRSGGVIVWLRKLVGSSQ